MGNVEENEEKWGKKGEKKGRKLGKKYTNQNGRMKMGNVRWKMTVKC